MVWMITLKKKYVDAFLSGKKTIELRTRLPKNICNGDIILCTESNSKGQVIFWFQVTRWYAGSPQSLWGLVRNYLCINLDDYTLYTSGRERVYGLYVENIKKIPQGVTVADFGLSKAPQWFASIKIDNKKILKHNVL